MKKYKIKACWTNGKEISSQPYFKVLAEVYTFENSVGAESQELFEVWREKNPESNGWKFRAWVEYEEV